MKKFVILFLCAITFQLKAQFVFQKVIGNANSSFARDVIQLQDTNYLITGASSGYGDYTANAFLMKIDQQGNHMWTKNFGGSNADWAMQLVEESDNSIVFAGYTNSFGNGGYDIWVVKTDESGNVIWSKTYGGSDWDFGYSIIKTIDNNYLIAGETYSYGSGNNDAFLLKINQSGDSLWMKTYGESDLDLAREVVTLPDGKFVFTGTKRSPAQNYTDIWVAKTDDLGNMEWEQTYGSPLNDEGHSLVLAQNLTDFIIGGTVDTMPSKKIDQYYFKIDAYGSEICSSIYGGPENETTHDVCERYNGNGYIAGMTLSYGTGFGDMIVYYPGSNCLWTGGPTLGTVDRDEAWSIKETLDSGYIVVGETEYGPGFTNIYAIKAGPTLYIDPNLVTYFDISATEEITSFHFTIYPNPASDKIQLDFGNTSGKKLLEIYDLSGKLCQSGSSNLNRVEVEVSGLNAGIYFVKTMVEETGISTTQKLVIRHQE